LNARSAPRECTGSGLTRWSRRLDRGLATQTHRFRKGPVGGDKSTGNERWAVDHRFSFLPAKIVTRGLSPNTVLLKTGHGSLRGGSSAGDRVVETLPRPTSPFLGLWETPRRVTALDFFFVPIITSSSLGWSTGETGEILGHEADARAVALPGVARIVRRFTFAWNRTVSFTVALDMRGCAESNQKEQPQLGGLSVQPGTAGGRTTRCFVHRPTGPLWKIPAPGHRRNSRLWLKDTVVLVPNWEKRSKVELPPDDRHGGALHTAARALHWSACDPGSKACRGGQKCLCR